MDNSCQLNPDDDKFSIESAVKFSSRRYVGRLAPTPSGYLHIGHAQTFWIAQQRSRTGSDGTGSLILRIEDLDGPRCKPHYLTDMLYDMSWFQLRWTHGPSLVATTTTDVVNSSSSSNVNGMPETTDGDDRLPKKSKMIVNEAAGMIATTNTINSTNDGSLMDLVRFHSFHGVSLTPFSHVFEQSRRMPLYHAAWRRLVHLRLIYPSPHSRKDVARALSAPHEGDEEGEPLFPTSLRPLYMQQSSEPPVSNHTDHHHNSCSSSSSSSFRCVDFPAELLALSQPNQVNWRFRVPDEEEEEVVSFVDGHLGPQSFRPGRDFGDFVVWRGSDGVPSYELAVVVDDLTMGVTEVVRGADLLLSTARQLLLFRALVQGLIIDEEMTTTTAAVATSSSTSTPVVLSSGPTNILPSHEPQQPQHQLIPAFYHCDLVRDPSTHQRLAKRMQSIRPTTTVAVAGTGSKKPLEPSPSPLQSQDTFTLQALREAGWTPDRIRSERLPHLVQGNHTDDSGTTIK